jgi:hypothetical protein
VRRERFGHGSATTNARSRRRSGTPFREDSDRRRTEPAEPARARRRFSASGSRLTRRQRRSARRRSPRRRTRKTSVARPDRARGGGCGRPSIVARAQADAQRVQQTCRCAPTSLVMKLARDRRGAGRARGRRPPDRGRRDAARRAHRLISVSKRRSDDRGGRGIRTREGLPPTRSPGVPLRPLGQATGASLRNRTLRLRWPARSGTTERVESVKLLQRGRDAPHAGRDVRWRPFYRRMERRSRSIEQATDRRSCW